MVVFECTVLVFSKAPVPGSVKTRLLPAVSENEAARIYRELVERTLNTVTVIDGWDVQLWCTPGIDHPFFRECADKYGVELHQQSGADIGARMHAAFKETILVDNNVLLVGCDCPELQAEDLMTAHKKLSTGYDVVLGPAEDGGYYLIGMNTPHPDLFQGIRWGQPTVFEETCNRLRGLRLDYYQLPIRWDLDDTDDLKRYFRMQAGEGEE